MSAAFTDGDQMAPTECASQRGGTEVAVPTASAPQTRARIVLGNELKKPQQAAFSEASIVIETQASAEKSDTISTG